MFFSGRYKGEEDLVSVNACINIVCPKKKRVAASNLSIFPKISLNLLCCPIFPHFPCFSHHFLGLPARLFKFVIVILSQGAAKLLFKFGAVAEIWGGV